MGEGKQSGAQMNGWAGWLLARMRRTPRSASRLVVRERLVLAPRQHLALVEADGRRFLIATASDGTPVFHALDGAPKPRPAQGRRISW